MPEQNAEHACIQWAPSGNPIDGVPGEMLAFLATDGMHHGYGYGAGWAVVFGTDRGDVSVLPGQWVTRYPDGRVTRRDRPHLPRLSYECLGCETRVCADREPSPGEHDGLCAGCWEQEVPSDAA